MKTLHPAGIVVAVAFVIVLAALIISCDRGSAKHSGKAFTHKPTWHIETVDSDGNVGKYTSIALDSGGYPHISYWDETNNALKYAYWGP
ncbi:hypothetical protein J7K50_06685 [bacterium]|nr:hypothetical protein [bacterium]